MKKILILILLLFWGHLNLDAQSSFRKLWTGLQTPQPESELPVGRTPLQNSKQKAKETIKTELVKINNNEWEINNGWELGTDTQVIESRNSIFDTSFDTSHWLNAIVPGTVLTTLVDQGIYPDPYFGLNNLTIPDTLCRMQWWYRNCFDYPEEKNGNRIRLLFNGINYRAEVFLNGTKLGNIEGAFVRGEFDITTLLKEKDNVLAVKIIPPHNPGIPHEQSIRAGQGLNGGALSLDGPTFISSVGWDWMPGIRDRNIGIWQNVRICTGGEVKIIDPQVISDILLPDTTQAKLYIHTKLKNDSDQVAEGKLVARIEDHEISLSYRLEPQEEKEVSFTPDEYPLLHFRNIRLWWPNGYGRQELYTLELEAIENKRCSDIKKVRFGIREMSYELMVHHDSIQTRIHYSPVEMIAKTKKPLFDFENRVHFSKNNQLPGLQDGVSISDFECFSDNDPMESFFVIRVNGVRIFCRGGNWGMDDAMKRCSRERLEPYIKLHQEMNFNIIRNWTGESTEEILYDLCDEYGLLVWNDFWITTDDTVEPMDQRLFLKNAKETVRRFRNHPSIAVWCPRNEGFAPKGLSIPLTYMLAEEDPTRHYHGQSRYLNMEGSGPWNYFEDPSLYYTVNAKGFNTEMGSFAIPTSSTLQKFLAPEDQWPINDVWAYHDFHHTSQNYKGFMAAINAYGEPNNMNDFSQKAQFVCYDAWRSMLESWNSRMWNNTSGLILWMSHPAWPSMIWQTYTYDYETPGSFFGAKKACEPIHIQRNLPNKEIVVVNTSLLSKKGLKASVSHYDISGKRLEHQSKYIDTPANSLTDCQLSISDENKPELYLTRLELKDNKGNLISRNDYWVTNNGSAKDLANLNTDGLTIKQKHTGNKRLITVHNPTKQIVPAIKLNAFDTETGEIILPAYFSDGYFNLLPNETKIIRLDIDEKYRKSISIKNTF
ncbi:glycoside hydrolase family 2 [Bacteroidales bacterium OttesenSCG-928-M11]|nr:glycoside hydrolase family 2 [Bacteroidales bacterium OttesenSCG-928-M11]